MTPAEVAAAAAWAEQHLVTADGRPVELQPYQREVLRKLATGQPLVLLTPRRPDHTDVSATAALLAMLEQRP